MVIHRVAAGAYFDRPSLCLRIFGQKWAKQDRLVPNSQAALHRPAPQPTRSATSVTLSASRPPRRTRPDGYDILGRQVFRFDPAVGTGIDGPVNRHTSSYDQQQDGCQMTADAIDDGVAVLNQVRDRFDARRGNPNCQRRLRYRRRSELRLSPFTFPRGAWPCREFEVVDGRRGSNPPFDVSRGSS